MTVYNSVGYAANAPIAYHGDRGEVQMARFVVNTTAVITTADTFNFGYMPANARLVGGYFAPTDGSAGADITISIGDAGSGTRLFNASTAIQAGTYTLIPVAALDYLFTAKTLIIGTIGVSATTTATATLVLVLLYVIDE